MHKVLRAFIVFSFFLSIPQTIEAAPESELRSLQTDPVLWQVRQTLDVMEKRYSTRPMDSAWNIAHQTLAYQLNAKIALPDGAKGSSVQWLLGGGTLSGMSSFMVKSGRYVTGRSHAGRLFQGHHDQFSGYLSELNLPKSTVVIADGKKFTIQRLIDDAKLLTNSSEQLEYTLWFLSNYLDFTDPNQLVWKSAWGEPWSMDKLLSVVLHKTPDSDFCGGAHRFEGIARAVQAYYRANQKLDGVWDEANRFLYEREKEAQAWQNNDGSLSGIPFRMGSWQPRAEDRVDVTGHQLEWLTFQMTADRLQQAWVKRAVFILSNDLRGTANHLDAGALYHALNALLRYERIVGSAALSSKLAAGE